MTVTAEELIALEREQRYKSQLERPEVFPSRENWEYIIEQRMAQLAPLLYRKFLVATLTEDKNRGDFQETALEMFPQYLNVIPRTIAVETVFSDVESNTEASMEIIHSCKLFDAPTLLNLLNKGAAPGVVALCVDAYQPEYEIEDIQEMKRLRDKLMNLPSTGDIRESRSIFGRDLRYVCQNGHSNNSQSEYCVQCGLNMQGLKAEEVKNIDEFSHRVRLLEQMFNHRKTNS